MTRRSCEKIFPEGDCKSPSGNIFSQLLRVIPSDINEIKLFIFVILYFSHLLPPLLPEVPALTQTSFN